MRAARLACLAVFGLMPLSGCSLLHSNIKGGFACTSPKGTCAPSMAIDDAAVHEIDAEAKDKDKATQSADASTVGKSDHQWIFVGPHPALRILYPAWRDATGHLHPRTTAYVPVEAPYIAPADVVPLDSAKLGAERDSSLLAIAEMAPDQSLLTRPATVGDPEVSNAPTPTGSAVSPASQAALQPTAAAKPGTGPIDAIRKQVADILASTPKAPVPAPTPTSVSTASNAPKPGASFPPEGK